MAAFYAERARGGVGLIVTGGIAPNFSGLLEPRASQLSFPWQVGRHRTVTDAVHAAGGKIALQILPRRDAMRITRCRSRPPPSALRSTPFKPRALTRWGVAKTVADYARCARLAQRAGYDGVEIMGSEGYLINQFVAPRTNHRTDDWGGALENRIRFPVEIVRRTREAVGAGFIVIFRLSMLDLVDGRQHVGGGRRARQGGRGGGRHAHQHGHRLARGARADDRDDGAARRVRVGDEAAQERSGDSADRDQPDQRSGGGRGGAGAGRRRHGVDGPPVPRGCGVRQQGSGRTRGRDQHVHRVQPGLPRPDLHPPDRLVPRQSAGLQRDADRHEAGGAQEAHRRRGCRPGGSRVRDDGGGGRSRKSRCSTPRPRSAASSTSRAAFRARTSSPRRFATIAASSSARASRSISTAASRRTISRSFDHVVLATGIVPRTPDIPGIGHPKVAGYTDIVMGRKVAGERVAIIGAGGIGFDVGEFLTHHGGHDETDEYCAEWGIDTALPRARRHRRHRRAAPAASPVALATETRERSARGSRRSTGWIRRTLLKKRGVTMIPGVEYVGIDDTGLAIRVGRCRRACSRSTRSSSARGRSRGASCWSRCAGRVWTSRPSVAPTSRSSSMRVVRSRRVPRWRSASSST